MKSPVDTAKTLAKELHVGQDIGSRKVPKGVLGYYDTQAKYLAVRSTEAGNISTTMHELGHAIVDKIGMNGTAKMIANLDPVSTQSYSQEALPGEAFAEFMWRYMTDLLANKRTKGGFSTKKEALEYVSTLKTQGSRNPDANITFAALFERFEAQHDERVKDTTMAGYKSAYKYFNDISAMLFASIGVDDLQYCIDAVPGKRTRQVMKALASLLYKYAGSRQIVDTNLAQYIYVGKGEQIERPAFTMAQLNTVRNAVGSVPYTDYILCMCYLGFRPNEMLSLTKKAYHEEDGASYLVGGFKTEAGTNRKVTISPKILPIIRRRLADKSSIYLFPKQDGSVMRDAYFRDIFYETLARLGIQPIPKAGERAHLVPYSCRHTFANFMKNVTGSDTDKAALMGHADASMTKKYQSEELENLVRITNAL